MPERRGSTTYDPIRDKFTNSDEAQPAEGSEDQADKSTRTAKRKRRSSTAIASESPENSPKTRRLDTCAGSNPQDEQDAVAMMHAKRSPSTLSTKPDGSKVLNATNLSALRGSKKAPSERTEARKRKPVVRRDRSPNSRQRSRSPVRAVIDTGRRQARTPPRRRTPSPEPIARTPTPPQDEHRKLKRPGGGARLGAAESAANRRRFQEKENALRREAQTDAAQRGQVDIVSEHYNAVPQRGREWRGQESKIKGLRSFNNWIKSALIQKFSPNEAYTPGAREQGFGSEASKGLLVLDIGCGKGGDLGKWQAAPQVLEYYVGLDPAAVSVDQARGRYAEMQRRARGFRDRGGRRSYLFQADFGIKDCYGESLASVQAVRQVGFNPNAGPDGQGYQPQSNGGFDVVSMMFCLHYAFESEDRARMMLKNVAGALKKDGRFLGVIPNSDVLAARLSSSRAKNKLGSDSRGPANGRLNYDEGGGSHQSENWDPEKPAGANGDDDDDDDIDDDWDPEKPSEIAYKNGKVNDRSFEKGRKNGIDDSEDDWDPEKPSEPHITASAAANPSSAADQTPAKTTDSGHASPKDVEWGNSIYRVKFPGTAPSDGIFRPMFGWKYFFFLEEAVEEVPEYVVPWEGFRALALEYDLELRYVKPFRDVWDEYKDDPDLGPLSERMKVRGTHRGSLLVSDEELEAASFYHAFCFYKV